MKYRLSLASASAAFLFASVAGAATRHVATTGADSGDCTGSPCKSITYGISKMAGGDELVVGDGTYAESITEMPSGTAAAYTTIRAENDWGVRIDGSNFPNTFKNGITVSSKHYVEVRGFKVTMNQGSENNLPIQVPYSDHVKIVRCGGDHAPVTGNAATFSVGPASSYVLVEEGYAFGGARYQFLAYQSDHVIVRRSVARNDYWNGSLQCAGFVNYDSLDTTWQNDIALDSDTANCSGRLYGGFFNENKTDTAPDTSEALAGNLVLNEQAFYAGDLDWVISGTRTIDDMVIWGGTGGYYGDQGDGVKAKLTAKHLTIGGLTGEYNGANGSPATGTGFSVFGNIDNSLTSSISTGNHSYGVADYTASDFNVLFGNQKASYGGVHAATPGVHDQTALDPRSSGLKYLPRIEAGSPLATAGEAGGRAGAEILVATGESGTLNGDPGWDQPTTQSLWPFPNESVIQSEMASYAGPGGAGKRGFTTGNSLDGSPQTLTKYVWELLGNPIPAEIYGPTSPSDGGASSSGTGAPPLTGNDGKPAGADGGASAGNAAASDDDSGCRATGGGPTGVFGIGLVIATILVRRRRR